LAQEPDTAASAAEAQNDPAGHASQAADPVDGPNCSTTRHEGRK
jgi:hypothetical protein